MARPGKGLTSGFAWKTTILSAVIVGVLAFIQLAVIYPSFIKSAVRDCRDEAVRDARHISHMLPAGFFRNNSPVSSQMIEEFRLMMDDFQLWKLKIFSARGEILYSSDESEIGGINERDYFYKIVAQGSVFTKPVWSKEVSLEGQTVPVDVVETYIPIMEDGTFMGACEIYYEITSRKAGLDRRIMQASLITLGTGGVLLLVIAALSAKAEKASKEQEQLEEQLIRTDRLAAVGTLASGVAHEFNNINVTVMGFSQLALKRDGLPPDVRSHLERIQRAAGRARSITNDLLDFTRQGGDSDRRGNLAAAAREALELVRGQYEREGITVRDRIDPVPDSFIDSEQIVQVVLNMLTNAKHAMEGRPTKVLTVRTGSKGRNVFASIEDSGHGMAEDKVSEIFTPFFSTKGERAEDRIQSGIKGTGLGLSVCHTIVRNHGGEISVESREGQGSTFKIAFPAAAKGETRREAAGEDDATA